MEKISKYCKLKKDIRNSKKKIFELKTELDFFYNFGVVETYSWFKCVFELKTMLNEEERKLSSLEKEMKIVLV